jgi:Domain of unknown function (DUF4395)
VERARGHHPREDLELEDARLDRRILLGECPRLGDVASEEADPAQPPLHTRVARRAGGKELARLVQLCEEGEMPVLQLGGCLVVELGRVIRGEEEHHREAVEFHRAMLILSGMKRAARLADPYRDLDVIDSRAPRFNQATIGVLSLVAVVTGWWWLLGVLAVQLAVGLTFGRRYCLPCLAYFELVQPRFGEGPLEDARPPRFANLVGAVFLGLATLAYPVGLATLGAALGGIVTALALLAAATGFCTGCEAYKLGCFLVGRPFVACPLPPRVMDSG